MCFACSLEKSGSIFSLLFFPTFSLPFNKVIFAFKKHFFHNILLHISLYIINIAGRISEAAMEGGGESGNIMFLWCRIAHLG
jgi:hypothetical protein